MKSSLKKKFRDQALSIGSWLTIGHTAVTEIMCQAGFEWLVIDIEHTAITFEEAQNMIQVIELSGITPLVRVGKNDPLIIKRVMDSGAHGVIVPMVNTPEEACMAVDAVYYPPHGKRGVGLARAQKYGLGFLEYKKWLLQEAVVIAQIEHIDAINNLEKILAVPGIDATIVGPYDLSASMGYPGEFNQPKVKAAIERYLKICKQMKKVAGFHVVPPQAGMMRDYAQKGFRFLAFSLDELFLAGTVQNSFKEIISLIKKH